MDVYLDKIMTLDEAKEDVAQARAEGKKIVFANGCFDLLHGGHVSYLEDASRQGDYLIVGLNSDESMREIKGPTRPIIPGDERAQIIAVMEVVDAVVLFDEPTCANLLETLRPDVHAKGTDYTMETVPEREVNGRLGIKTYIAGAAKEESTKDIVRTIIERYGPKKEEPPVEAAEEESESK